MGAEVLILTLAGLFLLILLGVHIAIALGVASVAGAYLITGSMDISLSLLSSTAYEAIRSHSLAVILLFVLMGEIINRSGAATDLYKLCDRALKKLPGRLAVATVIGNTIFATVSGVSVASAATFSRIAYPEMRRAGYQQSHALGVVAGSACLGMLIPPSVLLIVWAVLTEGSIGALFLAGIVPGLILGFAFAGYCVVKASNSKQIAPAVDERKQAHHDRKSEFIGSIGIVLLVFMVLGGIWKGIFTPTEAAGFGVLGSAVIAWFKGMRRKGFVTAIYDTGRTAAPILFLLIAGSMYARFMAMGGGANLIQRLFEDNGTSVVMIFVIMTLTWLLLGALIDSISVILLTLPVFFPIAMSTGVNEIAFAIYGILIIEAGLLTPPVGLLVFTVKAAVADETVQLKDIFKGSLPFWLIILAVAILVITVPELASWLPESYFQR